MDIVDSYSDRLREIAAPYFARWFEQCKELLGESADLEEYYDRLAEIYPELDSEDLDRSVASALAASALAGWYESEQLVLNGETVEFAEAEYALLPFQEAIDYFSEKQNRPTRRWDSLTATEHDAYFTVAGAKAAVLGDIRAEVDRALTEGTSRAEFTKNFDAIATRYGWNYKGDRDWRAGIIFQANLRGAYSDGRCQQMTDPAVLEKRDKWMWRHGNSRSPRPVHLALDGKVFPADHPLWNSMFPPCGFGCNCGVVSLSDRDLQRRGLRVETGYRPGDTIEVDGKRFRIAPDNNFENSCVPQTDTEREDDRALKRRKILSRMQSDLQREGIIDLAGKVGFGAIAVLVGIKAATLAPEIIGTEVTRVSAAWRAGIHKKIADEIRAEISEEKLQRVRDLLATEVKDKPLTVVLSGAGDEGAVASASMAEGLRKQGLEGEIVAAANSIVTEDGPNFLSRILEVHVKSLGLSSESTKALIGLILDRGANKVNLLGHSAGAVVVEDIAGILRALEIEVDNVITLGGISAPVDLGQTQYRRYISDIDQYQLLHKVARRANKDRLFKGIYHGRYDSIAALGNRGLLKSWLANKEVFRAIVEDFNGVPATQAAGKLEPVPNVMRVPSEPKVENAEELLKEVRKSEPEAPAPKRTKPSKPVKKPIETRLITPEEYTQLGINVRRGLGDYRVRINKNTGATAGTFNVQPTRADGYLWTPEQCKAVKELLEKQGVVFPDSFDPDNVAWREGFNYLKLDKNAVITDRLIGPITPPGALKRQDWAEIVPVSPTKSGTDRYSAIELEPKAITPEVLPPEGQNNLKDAIAAFQKFASKLGKPKPNKSQAMPVDAADEYLDKRKLSSASPFALRNILRKGGEDIRRTIRTIQSYLFLEREEAEKAVNQLPGFKLKPARGGFRLELDGEDPTLLPAPPKELPPGLTAKQADRWLSKVGKPYANRKQAETLQKKLGDRYQVVEEDGKFVVREID
ncbi:phage minor head protein [Pseudanabaena sp. PCC 6802]|uniref:phage head morphogenesis protein n=1 Tax=Pseudanabaena sp. PCC 6802 TaxID=118173 RepID=UPI000349E90C|nr:phage minor head protein [Pseudanabaena sp. PCC 6802]